MAKLYGQLEINGVSGVAPIATSSAILVTNLNSDLVDGKHVDDGQTSSAYLWSAAQVIAYVAANAGSKHYLSPVRVRATGNVNLASNLNGATIDGVTVATGDRILLLDQTTTTQDGVYVVASGAGNTARSTDFAVALEVSGYLIPVEEGTTYADSLWLITNNAGSDVVGTDDLTTTSMSGGESNTASNVGTGTGLFKQKSGVDLQFYSVGSADNLLTVSIVSNVITLTINQGNLVLNSISGALSASKGGGLTKTKLIGNGSDTFFDVTHSLGTVAVQVEVILVSDGSTIYPVVKRTDTNTVRVDFGTEVPTTNQYKVAISQVGVETAL